MSRTRLEASISCKLVPIQLATRKTRLPLPMADNCVSRFAYGMSWVRPNSSNTRYLDFGQSLCRGRPFLEFTRPNGEFPLSSCADSSGYSAKKTHNVSRKGQHMWLSACLDNSYFISFVAPTPARCPHARPVATAVSEKVVNRMKRKYPSHQTIFR
jgi:hypothetical protein